MRRIPERAEVEEGRASTGGSKDQLLNRHVETFEKGAS